jgi:menaquinol-cytochrome c reductase cytochrome b/c subunit
MAEVPEHLLKRAAERKAALEAKRAAEGGAGDSTAAEAGAAPDAAAPVETPPAAGDTTAAAAGGDDRMAALLARSAAAKARKQGGGAEASAGGDGGGGATATATAAPPAAAAGASAPAAKAGVAAPGGATVVGPAGHTQRLLTVVKAGSIQDVKAVPTDKVHVWPHLLAVEFTAALALTAFLFVFSTFVNAPLLGLANYNLTPNPSKAPWYFLGLQELLTMFHPMVAGVTIPGMGMFVMGAAGYWDKNPSNKPENRKFAIALWTVWLMFWAVLVIIGSFFRGEGFNFIMPWEQGVHHIFDL